MAPGLHQTTSTDVNTDTVTLRNLLPKEKLRGVPTATPGRYASGTIWPHGEFSLGYGKDRPDGGEWHEDPYVGLGVDDVAMAQRSEQGRQPLNLSDAPNSTIPTPRGQKGITGYGQQMVKAAGFLMGEKWPRHRKTLGTITLPPMSAQTRSEVVQAWPDLTRELLRWLERQVEKSGLPRVVVSVTEIQPSRLADSGQACLHWHLLWLNIPGRAGNWAVDPCDVRAWLNRVLIRKIPSYQGGYVNVNVKPVKGEVARYLAKYMSKGKQQVAEAMEDWGEGVCPRTWWNMTKPTRDMVKAATHKGRAVGQLLDSFIEFGQTNIFDETFAFLSRIEIEFDGVRYTCGWRGRFLEDVRRDVRGMLESLDI